MATDSEKTSIDPQQTSDQSRRTENIRYDIAFYLDWCKACGICMAFCPQKIILPDRAGKPIVAEPDKCIGCRFCETHCPDFAITVSEHHTRRRKGDV